MAVESVEAIKESNNLMKKKILIAVPYDTDIPGATYDTHMEFMIELGRREASLPYSVAFATVGGVFTPLAREKIAEAAVRDGYDYVFMFDSDMSIPVDVLDRLYKHDVDIVAPLAFMRRPPYFPVIFIQRQAIENGKPYFSTTTVKNYPKNKLFECDATGFGAVLIKTSVIKKMTPPYFMSTCGTGEDILFCLNAKNQANARVFVDTSLPIGHLKSRTDLVTEKTYEEYNPVDKIRQDYGDYSQEKKESLLAV